MTSNSVNIRISAVDRLTAPVGRVIGASERLNNALGQSSAEMSRLQRAGAQLSRLDRLQRSLGQTGSALDQNRRRTAELGRQLHTATGAAENMRREWRAVQATSDQLDRDFLEQKQTVSQLANEKKALNEQLKTLKQQKKNQQAVDQNLLQNIEELEKKTQRLNQTLERERTTLASLRGQRRAATDEARRLRTEHTRAEAAARRLNREFGQTRQAGQRLTQQHDRQREATRRLRTELREAGQDTRRMADAQSRLQEELRQTNETMNRQRELAERQAAARQRYDRAVSRAGSASMAAMGAQGVGQSMMQAISVPLGALRRVDQARGELQSLGFEDTQLIINRGLEMQKAWAGVDAASFTRAAYDIRSGISSLTESGVADMTEMATITARATKADVAQMTSLFATSYGIFKNNLYENETDSEFGEKLSAGLSASVQAFKTDGGKMQQAIESMGAGLATSGVLMAEQFSALGLLQASMSGGEAGTAMKAIESQSAVAQERFAAAGINVKTLDERGNLLSIANIIDNLEKEFGAEYTTEIGAQITRAFGSEEAVKVFKQLWGQGSELRKSTDLINEAMEKGAGFTTSMAKRRDDNWDARLTIVQQGFDRLALALGKLLVPALEFAFPALIAITDGLVWLADNSGPVGPILIGLTAGIGALAVALAPVVIGMSSLAMTMAWLGQRRIIAGAEGAILDAAGGGDGQGGRRGRGGRRSRLLSNAGLGAAAVGVAGLGLWNIFGNKESTNEEKAEATGGLLGGLGGGWAGAKGGALAGAAVGSFVPVIGTAIGAALGGVAGAIGGSVAGDWAGSGIAGWIFGDDPETMPETKKIEPIKAANTQTINDNSHIQVNIHTAATDPQAVAMEAERAITRARTTAAYTATGGELYDGIN